MDIPRDSSDIQIALACLACNGNGGYGNRRPERGELNGRQTTHVPSFQDCPICSGTGWIHKRPAELSGMELARLVQRLPQLNPPSTETKP